MNVFTHYLPLRFCRIFLCTYLDHLDYLSFQRHHPYCCYILSCSGCYHRSPPRTSNTRGTATTLLSGWFRPRKTAVTPFLRLLRLLRLLLRTSLLRLSHLGRVRSRHPQHLQPHVRNILSRVAPTHFSPNTTSSTSHRSLCVSP